MKKILFSLLLIILSAFLVLPVDAANYEERELIPVNVETTIVTKHFSYKDFYYNNNTLVFKGIKNLTDKERPISFSIGLFDKDRKNIGTIYYCSSKDKSNTPSLAVEEERGFAFSVKDDYLAENKKLDDIKYISLLSDNINCNTLTGQEYVGNTVEEIGIPKNTTVDSKVERTFTFIGVIAILLVAYFLYKYLFTNSYQNMDGDDVRVGYKKYNKELERQRKQDLIDNPPVEKPKKRIKTDEVLRQEEEASKEDKSGTDLHNLYK